MKFGEGFIMRAMAVLAVLAMQDDLRAKLKDSELAGTWHYDNLAAGISEAKKEGKPLLVVFR